MEDGRRTLHHAARGHIHVVREGLLDLLSDEQVAQLAEITDLTRRHLRELVPWSPPRKRKAGRGAQPAGG